MSLAKTYARIAITLPAKDLAAADRLAKSLDRSRSWVVAEAIRRFAASSLPAATQPPDADPEPEPLTAVAQARPRSGLGASRQAQLVRDLSLTPEVRVRAAEETLRLSERSRRPRAHTLRVFDRYLDFVEWKRSRDVGR